jgi:hypothetical protein
VVDGDARLSMKQIRDGLNGKELVRLVAIELETYGLSSLKQSPS